MGCITGSDIQEYNYTVEKAKQNDLEVIVCMSGFRLRRNSDGAGLGNFTTVDAMFQYVCGYETGLDKGLVDSCTDSCNDGSITDDQYW